MRLPPPLPSPPLLYRPVRPVPALPEGHGPVLFLPQHWPGGAQVLAARLRLALPMAPSPCPARLWGEGEGEIAKNNIEGRNVKECYTAHKAKRYSPSTLASDGVRIRACRGRLSWLSICVTRQPCCHPLPRPVPTRAADPSRFSSQGILSPRRPNESTLPVRQASLKYLHQLVP